MKKEEFVVILLGAILVALALYYFTAPIIQQVEQALGG